MLAVIISIIPLRNGTFGAEAWSASLLKGGSLALLEEDVPVLQGLGTGVELYSGFKGLTKMFHRFRDPKKSGFRGFQIPREPNPIP